MIDIHAHILPGLDDGAKTIEESLEMCRIAEEDGITQMVATPHVSNGIYTNSAEVIIEEVDKINKVIEKHKINIRIFPGADVHMTPGIAQQVEDGQILTLNANKKYILLEMPVQIVPPELDLLIFDLQIQGITSIISHPERNQQVQQHPDILSGFMRKGVLMQITAMSLTGDFGPGAETCAKKLLVNGLAHIIASDAHSPDKRPPVLSNAIKIAQRIIGEKQAVAMVSAIPKRIINRGSISYSDSGKCLAAESK